MVRAKTKTVLKREASKAKEELLQHALVAYQEALASNEVLSVREAAQRFNVPKTSLQERINGRRPITESNAERSWLDDTESEVIVGELIHSAAQGFPDTKNHLRRRVNAVIQDKLGDPSFHVGEKWVDRWLEKWGKYLSTYWSTSLDAVRARALNPGVIQDYFQKVQETISKYKIDPDCLWTMDESSFIFGHACKTRVIGEAGNRIQHSQRDGSRETATVMPLISAAGACMPPCVIFKGQKLNSLWSEPVNNPLECPYVLILGMEHH
jgi:hypothetical protein